MAKLKVNGHELRVVTLSKARVRDVIQLQQQSGLKMTEIQEAAEAADLFGVAAVSFLTQHNAGFTVGWNDLLDGPVEDVGEFVREAGDPEPEAEDEAEANPPVPAAEVEPAAAN